ncbi:hypothetical protein [Amycolatopsis regifaucium]|uniref:Uncharacterized protein n=1 Tax=Amycolatopsis regifaucium TaxID=546365 RepID=A0A154M6H4_9PSEU|nr:hypothetical protein [Amycolatopsis regifaucium]KZB79459.1 hypothetical protein AVL48_17945 [Amycolatopsis regifaucium]OKA07641.1 hypothetical protein ATP06_0217630 [Amycolatopsis regifaucium]SFH06527.1 hypothetical protein SAMN04489731_102287 [Amycolatopsis regifaucium]
MTTRRGLRRPEPKAAEPGSGPPQALKLVGTVLANTTLLTALLYFFGLVETQVLFAYFRVHYTLLAQTPDEIFARGADGLYLPVAGAAGTVLGFLVAVRILRLRLTETAWTRLLRICTPIAAVLGASLLVTIVFVALNPEPFRDHPGLPGLGFALGVLMLLFAWRRWTSDSRSSLLELVLAYALVSIGLFWAVSDYSAAVGTRRGFETAAGLPSRPAATLYSAESLNLTAGGVLQVRCAAPDAAYKYRYTGMKLLLQSGGQYVFVPSDWRASTGVAFVLPKTEKLRLEFGPARSVPPAAC